MPRRAPTAAGSGSRRLCIRLQSRAVGSGLALFWFRRDSPAGQPRQQSSVWRGCWHGMTPVPSTPPPGQNHTWLSPLQAHPTAIRRTHGGRRCSPLAPSQAAVGGPPCPGSQPRRSALWPRTNRRSHMRARVSRARRLVRTPRCISPAHIPQRPLLVDLCVACMPRVSHDTHMHGRHACHPPWSVKLAP